MYTIGIDFGTLSARAVLVDTLTGEVASSHACAYPHGVLTESLPTGEPLPADWALQHPADYLYALRDAVTGVTAASGVRADEVCGLALDVTASTLMPTDAELTPLCLTEAFAGEKHAWVKLWKHHGAQRDADRITERFPDRLSTYGGRANAEWAIPKIMETLREAPDMYRAAARFIEAGDWLVSRLTGCETRALCAAGFKYFYDPIAGVYPGAAFFAALDPALADLQEKLGPAPVRQEKCAGHLTREAAEWLGLTENTAVAPAHVDAHAGISAAGCVSEGQLLMNIGTSSCHMLLSDRQVAVKGISGSVPDGAFTGTVCYEAGQSAVGDSFEWALSAFGGDAGHAEMTARAEKLRPGESGLIALDWLGGNRSVLANADLTGLILGLTPRTKPGEIYRALLESTAFGARRILEAFTDAGLPVDSAVAAGGISRKNSLLTQIYADVLGLPVSVAEAPYGAALGSAIFAAVSAGVYPSVPEAVRRMTKPAVRTVEPIPENVRAYEKLYGIYKKLHDSFGSNGIMEELTLMRRQLR